MDTHIRTHSRTRKNNKTKGMSKRIVLDDPHKVLERDVCIYTRENNVPPSWVSQPYENNVVFKSVVPI